jgi:hypothetical protein
MGFFVSFIERGETMKDNVYLAAKMVIEYNITLVSDGENKQGYLWPCFVGLTGSGKTARAEKLASELGLKQHKLLLQTMNPEEIGGIPKANQGKIEWCLDAWTEESACVILDELDKPDRDHWSTILSLLTDRKIRQKELKNSVFVAAMQPVDVEMFLAEETGKALSARLIFLPVDANESYNFVSSRHKRRNIFHVNQKIQLPVLPFITARQLDWLAGFYDSMNPDKEILELILNGVCNPDVKEKVLEWLQDKEEILEPSELLKVLAKKPGLLDEMDLATVNILWQNAATAYGWTEEVLEKVLTRITCENERSQSFEVMKHLADNLMSSASDDKGYKSFVEPLSYEQWCNVIDKVSKNVVDFFTSKKEVKK